MNRRNFLKVAGAFATIELGATTAAGVDEASGPSASEANLAPLARSLPAATGLAASDGFEFSVTRLDGDLTRVSKDAITDATVYGTVFAGPTAVDVAVGLENRAVRNHLRADGFEVTGSHRGWTLFERRARNRHRTAALAGSTAVVGAGPVASAVRNDVHEAIRAVSLAPEARNPGTGVREQMIDHLGTGTHLSIDPTPDPRRTGESVTATGERYTIGPERAMVRSVTMFDSVREASAAGPEDTRRLPGPVRNTESVVQQGRAVLRDTRIPTDRFISGT